MPSRKIACAVCGYITLDSRHPYDICPVCRWQDEGVIDDPTIPTYGPNGDLSLEQARKNYQEFGAVDKEFIKLARKPTPSEKV